MEMYLAQCPNISFDPFFRLHTSFFVIVSRPRRVLLGIIQY